MHVDVPDDGVSVLAGEGEGHASEPRVVVGDFGFLGGVDVGTAVQGGDVVDDEVAGAFGVEL